MGKLYQFLESCIDKFVSRSDYTEAERNGVKKHLLARAKYKLAMLSVFLVIILVTLLIIGIAGISCMCAHEEIIGTWVLAEDYADGFDSDDCYIEFRDTGTYYREAYYRNGVHAGELSYNNGRVFGRGSSMITLRFDSGRLILERQSYETVTVAQSGRIEIHTIPAVSESYIRISKDYDLTDEQRSVLY